MFRVPYRNWSSYCQVSIAHNISAAVGLKRCKTIEIEMKPAIVLPAARSPSPLIKV